MKIYDAYGRCIHQGGPASLLQQDEESRNVVADESAASATNEAKLASHVNSLSQFSDKEADVLQDKNYRLQKWSLWIQGVLCFFTALAFGAAAYYAYVAKHQTEIMQQQLEASDRPWVKITSVKPRENLTFFLTKDSPRERDWKTQADETIDIVAKNVGHSVAINVAVKGRMTFTESFEALMKERNSACDDSLSYVFPVNLFPDEDTGNSQFIIGAEIVPPQATSKPPIIGGEEVPWDLPADTWIASPKLVGCFAYTSANTGVTHYTGFIYALEQSVPNPLSKKISYDARFFKVGENVPRDKLKIDPFLAGFDLN